MEIEGKPTRVLSGGKLTDWKTIVENLEKAEAIHIDSLNEASEFTGTWNDLVNRILPHIPQLADRLALIVWDTFGGILLTRLRDVYGSKIITEDNWDNMAFTLNLTSDHNEEEFFRTPRHSC